MTRDTPDSDLLITPNGFREYDARWLLDREINLAGMTALLTAAILLLARIFRLGFLADFLSRTVLVGFLTGVGVQVGVAMLGDMLGIPFTSRRTVLQIKQVVLQFSSIHWQTLAIAAFVVAAILVFKRLRPGWPVP